MDPNRILRPPTSVSSSATASMRGIDAVIAPRNEERAALIDVEQGGDHYGSVSVPEAGEIVLVWTFLAMVERVMELSTSCAATG